jgi:predicted nucleic acid-binding protein
VILADTSIWIDHLRHGNAGLARLLQQQQVAAHPLIIGELACGTLANRREILELLQQLPQFAPAADTEVLQFIERHRIMGRGVGYVDVHLLAACAIQHAVVWSRDRRLVEIATELRLAWSPMSTS